MAGQALHIEMLPPAGAMPNGRATVAVNSLGVIDLLQIAVAGCSRARVRAVSWLIRSASPVRAGLALTKFTANPSGAAVAQAIGPMRTVVAMQPAALTGRQSEQRYPVVTVASGSDQPVLQQQTLRDSAPDYSATQEGGE